MTVKEQLKAIAGVAKLSFRVAPGPVIFKLVGAALDAILPLVTTYFAALTTTELVAAFGGEDGAGRRVLTYIAITAALGFAMTLWSSIDNYVQAKMRYVVEAAVSDRMYSQFLALDFWQYDNKDTADMFDRAMKFSQFFGYVFDRVASLVSSLIGVVFAIIALALFEPLLAVIVLVAIIPGMVIQFKLSRKQIKHWNQNVEVRRRQSMLEWQLSHPRKIAELRLYGMVDFMLRHRRSLRDTDEQTRVAFEKQFLPLRALSDGLTAAVELGALIWVSLQIIARNQPVGQFLYVQQVVSRALQSASSFISTASQIDEDIANLFDYEQFMQLPVMQPSGKKLSAPPQTITFEHVSFTYPESETPVLQDVSLTITRNQHVSIVGENGAGKTTFIKLLVGFYRPTSGRILLDGVDLHEYDITSWHKQLGVLQQDFLQYEFGTVRDNVRFGSVEEPYDDARFETALKQAEAYKFVQKLPKKADNYLNPWMEDAEGTNGVNISGGQWQRLALARDFYRHAPIIVLDEPTSAIDALAEDRIFTHLFAQHARTVVTISHRLSTIKKADQIYLFQEGILAESGTHEELVAKNGAYVHMFKSQL